MRGRGPCPGETCFLIGSSGVGDHRGRHTTSQRELILLADSRLIRDMPGLREVGLIDADEGVASVFDGIEQRRGLAVEQRNYRTTKKNCRG